MTKLQCTHLKCVHNERGMCVREWVQFDRMTCMHQNEMPPEFEEVKYD
jgi:hypothetical protein